MGERAVNELFGAEGTALEPSLGLPITLLVAGLMLAVLGMLCSAAPGGLIVLLGWVLLEREQRRLDAGALPPEHATAIARSLRASYVAVLLCVLLFGVQLFLYCSGAYDALWGRIFALIRFGVTG
jgi:ABC-type Fe3+ transport system permease subunit